MENREYQTEAEQAVWDFLIYEEGNGIMALPGGCGKSYIMARLCKRILMEWPMANIMVLQRDAKLITQNSNELLNYWPQAPIGIYSSELKQRDTLAKIVFGGIQSVAKRAHEFGDRHIIFIDESDQVSPTEATQYQTFIEGLKERVEGLRIIGPTATAYRMGIGCLTNMDLWDKIIIDFTRTERFNRFIEEGHLCKLVTKKTKAEVDITNVSMKGGEFNEKELQEVSDTDELNKAVVEECVAYGGDRKHWLVFASGVKHGHNLERAFRSRGVSAAMVSADKEMKRIVGVDENGNPLTYAKDCENKFRSGEIRCLINVGLFGRGWNFKALDLIAWVRATQSVALWIQGCVRGTRTYPGKESCLVLDFCSNIKRLGAVNDPIVPKPRRKGDSSPGEAPLKCCPECFSYVAIQAKECVDCGYVFPPPKTINKTASSDDILSSGSGEPLIEDFRVLGIKYTDKLSKAGNPYMEVRYNVITNTFKEVLMFGSDNAFIRRKIEGWWSYRRGNYPIPESVEEALERTGELRIPTIIRVNVAGRYPEVVGCDWDEDAKLKEEIELDNDEETEEPF